MIIEELHWATNQEIDRLSNGRENALPDTEIDRLLNVAIQDYFQLAAYGKNPKQYNIGIEADQQRIDMLDTLIYQDTLSVIDDEIDFSDTTYKFATHLNWVANTKKCGEVRIDLIDTGTNYSFHKKSSKRFKVIVANRINNGLKLILDNQFEVISVALTYFKKPNVVSLGTYPNIISPNSTVNQPKVETDLPEEFHYLLPIMAAQEYMRINGRQEIELNKRKINELL